LDIGTQPLLRLNDSELTDLLALCADAINSDGLGAGESVASRIAGNEKFREVLTALGAADPACPLEPLTWGIAVLLDKMERLM
jgi:hypothetical protein